MPTIKRSRGQQPGSRNHGRTERPHLPIVAEPHELHNLCCDHCGLQYNPLKGDEESQVVEISVNAYVRHIQRKRDIKSCSCPSNPDSPKIIVAPPPPKVIPKSGYGTSIWVYCLVHKFLYGQPLNRILHALANYGSPLAAGTMTDGLKKISSAIRTFLYLIKSIPYSYSATAGALHRRNSNPRTYKTARL